MIFSKRSLSGVMANREVTYWKLLPWQVKLPLRLASDFDLGWDFTLYSEGMMALDNTTKRVDYISVDRLIHQPPLDTDYVSC